MNTENTDRAERVKAYQKWMGVKDARHLQLLDQMYWKLDECLKAFGPWQWGDYDNAVEDVMRNAYEVIDTLADITEPPDDKLDDADVL